MNKTPRALQWTAVKVFTAPPALIGVLATFFLTTNGSINRALPYITQVAVSLVAIALTSFCLSPVFGRASLRSLAAGIVFGLLVCSIGSLAFGFTAAIVYPDFTVRAYVLAPFYNIALCGLPVAVIAGFVFAGAARYYDRDGHRVA